MTRAIVLAVVLVHGVAAAATTLQATSRPSRSSARLSYASTDALAGLDKGAGTDPGAVSAEVFVRQGGVTTRFEVPAGAYLRGPYPGRFGWVANDAAHASYLNRNAPGGPTGILRTLFATGRRVKLSAKNLGDANPLDLAGAPATPVDVAYVITNGSETHTHCTRFSSCTYTPLDGGAGWKLRCTGGVADLACSARPTCGNGIVEHGEQCDGGFGCSPQCTQGAYSCCQGVDSCVAAPVFSLQFYLMQYCSIYNGTPQPGLVCDPDGTCRDHAIDPVPVCCQQTATTCFQQSADSVADVWYDQYYCLQGSGIGGPVHIEVNATCGADGACIPE